MKNQKKVYNSCDGGHETYHEIRRLDTGGGSAMLVCYSHYLKEMKFRRDRNQEDGTDFELPTWESLKIDQPEV